MTAMGDSTISAVKHEPFRHELLSAERLAECARDLARQQTWIAEPGTQDTPLLTLVASCQAGLKAANDTLADAVRLQQPIAPAAEWLLDNYYLIEEQIRLVKDDLPAGYGRELPRLSAGPFLEYPRVFEAVVELLSHTDSRLDEEVLSRFIDGFQDVAPLAIGEIWGIPIVLRIALIENLNRLSGRVLAAHASTGAADAWADRLLLAVPDGSEGLRTLIAELESQTADAEPVFLMRLAQRLSGRDTGVELLGAWLERRFQSAGIELDELAHELQQSQAADQVSIANSITSIRFLDAYEWRGFFEHSSFVEQILREDPAGVYPRMDFKSRDRYRHALEGIARRCPHSEIAVAEAIVSWASASMTVDPTDEIRCHVGFYLISAGRYELEKSVSYRPRFRERLYRGPLARKGPFYWGMLAGFTALLSLLLLSAIAFSGAVPWVVVVVCLVALMPLSDLALNITNRSAAWVFPPRMMPKLDYLRPVSEAHRTLVVIPALFSSAGAVRHVLDNLEIAYLANRDDEVHFGVLGDLRTSAEEHMPGDAAVIEAAREGVNALNDRYEVEHGRRPFCLFIRERIYDERERTWMGWERKRGALVELNRALRGSADTTFSHRIADEQMLSSVTFVITLDSDTVLPRDAARKLISTIAHPLNRASLAPGDRRVRAGYGLIQPRVGMSLPASSRSFFAWLYSGETGVDPYVGAVSDTYQDVFGEGSFTGKGIYEVSVFNAVLEGRFPDDTLLSHDLIEGCYLRVALASDIEVLDDHPASYLSHMARIHRWVRGDWQTIPWLAGSVPLADGTKEHNVLTPLHRWKLTDNIRRSLVAPSLVLLMTLGWLLLPGPAWAWPLVMTLVIFFPVYFSVTDSLLFRSREVSWSSTLESTWRDFGRDSARALLTLSLLPHQAQTMIDASVRALWRMTVSRRKLLEWETAADADKRIGSDLRGYVRKLGPASVVALLLLAPAALQSPQRTMASLGLALLWAAAPLIAWRVSKVSAPATDELDSEQRAELRRLARRTWRFFETFVTPEGHHLAPDNFQEDPNGEVAWRTSPTNIGLQLLSNLTAYDLGYVTLPTLIQRCADTLASMAGLERFRGHYYNWYDIRTLAPLPPNYISTVDSGNLAGHLLVLRIGLLEASESPVLGPAILRGIADTASLAIEDLIAEQDALQPADALRELREQLDELERDVSLEDAPKDLGEWHAVLSRLRTIVGAIEDKASLMTGADEVPSATSPHPATPVGRAHASVRAVTAAIEAADETLTQLAPWALLLGLAPNHVRSDPRCNDLAPILELVPSLVGLAEGLTGVLDALRSLADEPPGDSALEREQAVAWAESVRAAIVATRPTATEILGRLHLDAEIAREMWEHTDFKMLFDERRLLFSIGYNTAEGRLDNSYYDMLASECRLASFLAIAKGDVGQEHWFRLGRAITQTGGGRALLSWSASMFEYLMPLLVMRSWSTTLLDQTYASVVLRQIQYGRERGVPWGVSESAFNAKDAGLVYQYQAFGVPGLGLKRGLSDDIVIAPYATVLALPIAPAAAVDNLRELAARGARGRYGFYEALDFTPGRIPAGSSRAIVKAYFAHHQGMSFVALGNELAAHPMYDRFHRDPMVASAELLLQERVPRHIQLATPNVGEVEHVRSVRELPPPVTRAYPIADTPVPSTHFLSNGRYSVMVTNGGGGYSRWQGVALSRYREDVTRDCWGQFIYVRNADTGAVFNATHNPGPTRPDEYHVTFSHDKAEYRRIDGTLETHTEVSVSPEDDIEVRRVTVTNHDHEPVRLEVTSYFEVALADQAADQAHKSFSNLFVETEALEPSRALLFSRRPRSAEEERLWGLHVLACDSDEECDWSYETDRALFLGRLNGADDPAAVRRGGALSRTTGAVLDPCCAIRQQVTIDPGASSRLVFVTGIAATRPEAERLADKYRDPRSAQRAIDLAWTAAQIELRDLGITPAEAVVLERLASRLLLTDPASVLKIKTPVENGLPMSGLWSIGISGDLPILLVRIEELEHAPLVRQALLAHQYWRHKGLVADLVVLNTRPTAYSDELDDRLRMLVRTGHALQLLDKPGGVFLRRADQMHPDVLNLLLTVARATLDGDSGSLEVQLNRRVPRPELPDAFVPALEPVKRPIVRPSRPDLLFDNGYGGFDSSAGEYVIVLDEGRCTPAPWINVMASPGFGCTVSEAGIGCTWALNSHENRITTWNNDPVSDGSGEVIYLRDEQTGEFWSPTPLPSRAPGTYTVRHGRGHSVFEHESHGIAQRLEIFIPAEDPVRVARLTLRNTGSEARSLSATQFIEWSLGSSRSKSQHLVVTWYDAEFEMLTAHNHFNMDFPGRATFIACDAELHSFTASRSEFVGRNGTPGSPAAMGRKRLGGVTGRFHDNCGALMARIELEPGQERTVTFLLGQTDQLALARELVTAYRNPARVQQERDRVAGQWADILGTVQARTPDPALDLLVNGQLLYQALACRLWGRTATYQSSGAFGFRDQLQDGLALLLTRPDLVREQIVEASRHQFERGDVLHWWQPGSGRGVRTRITDDRHWLPFVVAEYIEATGDTSVLQELTAFIEGPQVDPEREDNYLQPAVSEKAATVYEHCIAALESGRGTGAHGLPLMGGGDWNDGMNRVGIGGQGESVWMAWFLIAVLRRFAPLCAAAGDTERARSYEDWATELGKAAEESGWDGSWYRRAYFDDGTPLGSRESQECRIDAIAQAWATISGAGDPDRSETALDSVEDKLVDREHGLIALLAPPFDTMAHDPGYIKGYVPGVRENGGQYTHAAVWVVLAHLLRGNGDEAHGLLSMINPIGHARSASDAELYKVEPYVVAADVYGAAPHSGRGGWTWYTGSASWFYRVAVKDMLGLWVTSESGSRYLRVDPCIPKSWKGYDLTYRTGETTYSIGVENPRGVNRGVAYVELDGVRLSDTRIPIIEDGGRHDVRVVLLGG